MKIRHREKNSPRKYNRPGFTSRPGDVIEVDSSIGEDLVDRKRYFEPAPESAEVDVSTIESDVDQDTGAGEGSSADGGNSIPAEDPSEEPDDFDAEEWLSVSYQERAELVRNGEADEYLASIEEAETSETVEDAVDERREELK